MKSNETISGEGKINQIPKMISVSKRFLSNNNYSPPKYKIFLHNLYSSRNSKSFNTSIKTDFRNDVKIKNNTDTIELNKNNNLKLKRTESNSTTSITSNTEKIKKVTFSTVEIIRIQNHKNFNRLNSYKADEIKRNKMNWKNDDICTVF